MLIAAGAGILTAVNYSMSDRRRRPASGMQNRRHVAAGSSALSRDSVTPVPVDRLARRAELSGLNFATTADLPAGDGPLGQERALDAIRFGAEMQASGFNLFVIGTPDSDKERVVRALLEERARARPSPPDWVYLNNFSAPHRPRAVSLPPGRAPAFKQAVDDLIADLEVALPAAFESQDYQARRSALDETLRNRQEEAFSGLSAEAASNDVAIVRTPYGFGVAPVKAGQILKPEEINALQEADRVRMQSALHEFEKKVEHIIASIPNWDKERRDRVRALDRDTARLAVGHSIAQTREQFHDLPAVLEYLDLMQQDLLDNAANFIATEAETEEGRDDGAAPRTAARAPRTFERYEVNVLVSRPADAAGAPVIEEAHPTLGNLIGRVEHRWQQGLLTSDFRLVKAGALHRANGGYLILDAHSLLTEPYSWMALKRALKTCRIKIGSVEEFLGLISTVSVEPDPIELDVKVVLVGEPLLYYLLAQFDPEFGAQFKVLADFDDVVSRDAGSESAFTNLIASIARREQYKPLDRGAVAAVIEHAARIAEDSDKLTLRIERVRDLLAEADFWSTRGGAALIARADVERAIAEQERRSARIRDRMMESTLRGIALIESEGRRVGQVNGLSVVDLGSASFGRPTRITARVRPGSGKVIDIEREVALGGPIHSKGVLILSGYLAGRYAIDAPMSLLASLVFEQSYGGVEGDSASSAELYAILSALAEVSVRQDLAVTGSVNQFGQVQAIGGVNQKIEGFFHLCRQRGLTGSQGVLIPEANVQHLMLRDDVIDACRAGRFAIYPVREIDHGIGLLTGVEAGERGSDGAFTAGSINARVEERLREFAKARRKLASESDGG
jgi:lon-related putative ATP-dependent protease